MGRRRKKNKGLPERVYVDYGKQRVDGTWPKPKYYLKPVKPPRLFLGNSEAEMYRNYIKLIERPKNIKTMNDLIDDYLCNISSKKSEKNYYNEQIKAKFLKAFFGDFYPSQITTRDIYEYMDLRSVKTKVESTINGKKHVVFRGGKGAANKELTLLSSILNYSIRKGLLDKNPCRDVKKFSEKPRDRYPEHWELQAVYNAGSEILKCILNYTYLVGQRRSDVLFLQEANIREEGIYITQAKSKNNDKSRKPMRIIIKWNKSLKECIEKAQKLKCYIRSKYLFCKKNGEPYTEDGFKSMYNRAMRKALAEGTLKEKFNYHDIRAKTYSDDKNREERRKRAGHTSHAMSSVYDRLPTEANPMEKSITELENCGISIKDQ